MKSDIILIKYLLDNGANENDPDPLLSAVIGEKINVIASLLVVCG